MSVDGVDAGAMKRPPPEQADPVELLREWPELGAFGADWLRTWAPPRGEADRGDSQGSAEISLDGGADRAGARGPHGPVLCGGPCGRDGSEACISLVSLGGWAYCSADGGVTVERLELEFSRLEPHEGGVREVYRPKKRSILAKAKEYIRIL
jgi:hypothetical protein